MEVGRGDEKDGVNVFILVEKLKSIAWDPEREDIFLFLEREVL